MQRTVAMLIMLAIVLMSAPVFAGNLETFTDTLTGQNSSCDTLMSNEIVKQFNDVEIPFINQKVTWQIGLKYTNSVRSFVDNNSLEFTNRIIF